MTTVKKKKTKTKRPPPIRFSAAVVEFICGHLEAGMTLAEIVRTHPTKVPTVRTIFRWQRDNAEFQEQMNFSYSAWLQVKLDELDYVSTAPRDVLYPKLDARDAYEARRARMDALKFICGKMGAVLSSRWNVKKVIEHLGLPENAGVTVVNYATVDTEITTEGEVNG